MAAFHCRNGKLSFSDLEERRYNALRPVVFDKTPDICRFKIVYSNGNYNTLFLFSPLPDPLLLTQLSEIGSI